MSFALFVQEIFELTSSPVLTFAQATVRINNYINKKELLI